MKKNEVTMFKLCTLRELGKSRHLKNTINLWKEKKSHIHIREWANVTNENL